MKEVRDILRQSLPEIIAGLAVAVILGVASLLYTNLGVWSGAIVLVAVVVIVGAWLFFKQRNRSSRSPSARGLSVHSESGFATVAPMADYLLPIKVDTLVRFDTDAMESIFYRAARFKHEVGGVLVGTRLGNEVLVKRIHDGFEIDPSKVLLESGESVIGFWHSHIGYGVFLSSTDQSVMRTTMVNRINVIVDATSKGEAIAAYAIVDGEIVTLRISQN